jgi:hypothetical protein
MVTVPFDSCPACDRPVVWGTTCPYCETNTRGVPYRGLLRLLVFAFLAVGLTYLLWLCAACRLSDITLTAWLSLVSSTVLYHVPTGLREALGPHAYWFFWVSALIVVLREPPSGRDAPCVSGPTWLHVAESTGDTLAALVAATAGLLVFHAPLAAGLLFWFAAGVTGVGVALLPIAFHVRPATLLVFVLVPSGWVATGAEFHCFLDGCLP